MKREKTSPRNGPTSPRSPDDDSVLISKTILASLVDGAKELLTARRKVKALQEELNGTKDRIRALEREAGLVHISPSPGSPMTDTVLSPPRPPEGEKGRDGPRKSKFIEEHSQDDLATLSAEVKESQHAPLPVAFDSILDSSSSVIIAVGIGGAVRYMTMRGAVYDPSITAFLGDGVALPLINKTHECTYMDLFQNHADVKEALRNYLTASQEGSVVIEKGGKTVTISPWKTDSVVHGCIVTLMNTLGGDGSGKVSNNSDEAGHDYSVAGVTLKVSCVYASIHYPQSKIYTGITESVKTYMKKQIEVIGKFPTADCTIAGNILIASFGIKPRGGNKESANDAQLACSLALQLNENVQWLKAATNSSVQCRVGVSTTDEFLVYQDQNTYCSIGENVTAASTLEGLQRYYNVPILIDSHTALCLHDAFLVREIDAAKVYVSEKPIVIYQLMGDRNEGGLSGKKSTASDKALCHVFAQGYELYKEGKFDKAITSFSALLKDTKDAVAEMYVERCNILKGGSFKWNGVWNIEKRLPALNPSKTGYNTRRVSSLNGSTEDFDSEDEDQFDAVEEKKPEDFDKGFPVTATNLEKVLCILNATILLCGVSPKIEAGLKFASQIILNSNIHGVSLKTLEDELAPQRRGAVDLGAKSGNVFSLPVEMRDVDVTRWFAAEFGGHEEYLSRASEEQYSVEDEEHRIKLLSAKSSTVVMSVNNWNFDIMELSSKSGGSPLSVLTPAIIGQYNLFQRLHLNQKKFGRFIDSVEISYQRVPYHCNLHAVDVLQAVNFFLGTGDVIKLGRYSSLEILGSFFAAIIHDVDHPGVTNAYCKSTQNNLAIRYNDMSPLEMHHCATGFTLLNLDQNYFFEKISKPEYNFFRDLVIQLVLATDLAKGFEIVGLFKQRLLSRGYVSTSPLDKLLLLKMVMKVSDVSNPMRKVAVSKYWTKCIISEFYAQGDKEREANLPISPMCDRNHPTLAKSQTGFIDFVVRPVFVPLYTLLGEPLAQLAKQLDATYQYWKNCWNLPEGECWKELDEITFVHLHRSEDEARHRSSKASGKNMSFIADAVVVQIDDENLDLLSSSGPVSRPSSIYSNENNAAAPTPAPASSTPPLVQVVKVQEAGDGPVHATDTREQPSASSSNVANSVSEAASSPSTPSPPSPGKKSRRERFTEYSKSPGQPYAREERSG